MKHVVGFSGGVDSQACLWWARQRFGDDNVIAMNSDVGGHEHPITTEFIKQFSETVFPVVQVTPLVRDLGTRGTRPGKTRDRRQEFNEDDVLSFDRLAYIKQRFPSRKAQFCTEHLKLAPQRRWCDENLRENDIEFERYAGVRCDESNKRADTPDRTWDDYFNCWINYPIRCWTKQECFSVLKKAGEEVNPLYRMGFGRVGCAPCVNASKGDVREWSARFPEMIDKVRDWEESVGKTFFMPLVPGMEINWIDDVVKWSKTAHGGKQPMLPLIEVEADAGMCSSKYGLCE
ncbi:phosphoadenosine phosphosulfate reductase family protein [Gimesia sp.]|uniref:phosphoadenosine phosphosulfate reductase domain-containing protein n=1 Tax=Gimesia sp. TaxID=2024833 RepID=UPI0032EF1B07